MDKTPIIILGAAALSLIAASAYVLSGKKLSKMLPLGEAVSVKATFRRRTSIFTNGDSIARFYKHLGEVRLRRSVAEDNSANAKIGGGFFITLSYKDGSALDFYFSEDFSVCRIGNSKRYRVVNPAKAKLLELDYNFAAKNENEE